MAIRRCFDVPYSEDSSLKIFLNFWPHETFACKMNQRIGYLDDANNYTYLIIVFDYFTILLDRKLNVLFFLEDDMVRFLYTTLTDQPSW